MAVGSARAADWPQVSQSASGLKGGPEPRFFPQQEASANHYTPLPPPQRCKAGSPFSITKAGRHLHHRCQRGFWLQRERERELRWPQGLVGGQRQRTHTPWCVSLLVWHLLPARERKPHAKARYSSCAPGGSPGIQLSPLNADGHVNQLDRQKGKKTR